MADVFATVTWLSHPAPVATCGRRNAPNPTTPAEATTVVFGVVPVIVVLVTGVPNAAGDWVVVPIAKVCGGTVTVAGTVVAGIVGDGMVVTGIVEGIGTVEMGIVGVDGIVIVGIVAVVGDVTPVPEITTVVAATLPAANVVTPASCTEVGNAVNDGPTNCRPSTPVTRSEFTTSDPVKGAASSGVPENSSVTNLGICVRPATVIVLVLSVFPPWSRRLKVTVATESFGLTMATPVFAPVAGFVLTTTVVIVARGLGNTVA